MTDATGLQREKALAVLIFMLWSVSVVFVPLLSLTFSAAAMRSLSIVYILLQVGVFLFSLYTLALLLPTLFHFKGSRRRIIWGRTVLYLYVLAALGASIVIGSIALFIPHA